MGLSDRVSDVTVVLLGALVLLAPMVIIGLTVSFLALTGDLVLGRLTLLEFLELYVIELVVFTGFAYGLYRLTMRLVVRQLQREEDAPGRLDVTDGPFDAPSDDRE